MKRLQGKVAIVTGSSQGIGAAVALGFAAEGARVCVNYVSCAEGARRVAEQISGAGGEAIIVKADVSQAPDVAHLVQATQEAFGAIDILVNNGAFLLFASAEGDFITGQCLNVDGGWALY
jgi:3-oxoacyl-[acyl-carrier protein] reductase